jgi:hypothetical protein
MKISNTYQRKTDFILEVLPHKLNNLSSFKKLTFVALLDAIQYGLCIVIVEVILIDESISFLLKPTSTLGGSNDSQEYEADADDDDDADEEGDDIVDEEENDLECLLYNER